MQFRHYEALMPETGHSGCDLYTFDNASDTWLWIGSNLPAFFAAGSGSGSGSGAGAGGASSSSNDRGSGSGSISGGGGGGGGDDSTSLTLLGELFSDGQDLDGAFWRPNVVPESFFATPRHYMLYLPLCAIMCCRPICIVCLLFAVCCVLFAACCLSAACVCLSACLAVCCMLCAVCFLSESAAPSIELLLMNVCAGLRVKLIPLLSDNGPTELSVGVEKGAWAQSDAWSRGEFCQQRPIIWFGTSIAEGGAAQRPGAQYLNMLTRKLGRVVINAAFAGPVSHRARPLLARQCGGNAQPRGAEL